MNPGSYTTSNKIIAQNSVLLDTIICHCMGRLEGLQGWVWVQFGGPSRERLQDANVPSDSNEISSDTLFNINTKNSGELGLKCRIFPCTLVLIEVRRPPSLHSGRHADYPTAPMFGNKPGFTIRWADIKGASMQSRPITRHFYIRPPKDFPHEKGKLWKLPKLSYGMREAIR